MCAHFYRIMTPEESGRLREPLLNAEHCEVEPMPPSPNKGG